MASVGSMKLNPDSHLILDQPLLRLPHELLRKNFKSAQLVVEKDSAYIKTALKDTANASLTNKSDPDEVLKNLDSMIARMRGLKRKIAACADEEARLLKHSRSRLKHLGELYEIQTLDDVKFDTWSRCRLDRLLVDYCLRNGYSESAKNLAKEKGIDELVDCETFVQMNAIRNAIKEGKVVEALAWCQENKKELRKMNSKLEFSLRFQQYIELARTQTTSDLHRAVVHFRKYIAPMKSQYPVEVAQAGGLLLSYSPSFRPRKYQSLYAKSRWEEIATLFAKTHNELLGLHAQPLLHVALSAGLSALKTPACHAKAYTSTTTAENSSRNLNTVTFNNDIKHPWESITPTVSDKDSKRPYSQTLSSNHDTATPSILPSLCPICSIELNDLARSVPYAQHTKSHVDADAVLLPNGWVYGLSRVEEYARKAGLGEDFVRDLRSGEAFGRASVRKVFIS